MGVEHAYQELEMKTSSEGESISCFVRAFN